MPPRPLSARAKLVDALAKEILARKDREAFPIDSEHELCARFKLSRVTVRLALGDLENRGLIFREHGRGTFGVGAEMKSAEISMLPKDWQKLDKLRGKKSRGEWVAEQLRGR